MFVYTRLQLALLAIMLLAGCASQPAVNPSLYERLAVKLADRGDLDTLDQPPAELKSCEWMLGQWSIEATVFATASSPERIEQGTSTITPAMRGFWFQMNDEYPKGTQDTGFITYNRVTRLWVSVGIDSVGNAVTMSAGKWEGDRLVLGPVDAVIVGEPVQLRQTLEKRSANEFVLLNEERMGDGSWRKLDQYRYRRR